MQADSAAISLRDDVAAYRANGTIVTDETLRDWERRLTALAFPVCSECGEINTGQKGAFPCPTCGVPRVSEEFLAAQRKLWQATDGPWND